MNTQSEYFKLSEGNAWFKRNEIALQQKIPENDLIFNELISIYGNLANKYYLEIGCSNGFRLHWIKQAAGMVCGVEPGKQAVTYGKNQFSLTNEEIIASDAFTFFKTNEKKFDIISFAHCLYLIPPAQIPNIVAGAIHALNENGLIIIYDFDSLPQSVDYQHHEGLKSYKAVFSDYFAWIPYMRLIKKLVVPHEKQGMSQGNPKNDCALSILKKISIDNAFPKLQQD